MRNSAKESSYVEANPGVSDEFTARGPALERHYGVDEITEMWGLSKDAVRRIFRGVPGVLVIGTNNPQRGKRRYTTLRIPQSVLERVHLQYSFGNHVLIRYPSEPK